MKLLFQRLFPPTCVLCESATGRDMDLCQGCEDDLSKNLYCCPRCALPLEQTVAEKYQYMELMCGDCQSNPPSFDECLTPFLYQFPLRELILRYKKLATPAIGKTLAQLMARTLADELVRVNANKKTPDYLIPVPTHQLKLKQRGFDHTLLLAREIGQALNIPVIERTAIRGIATAEQKGLSRLQRKKNMRNNFSILTPINAKSVAIIDDVMTTGATANEFAKLLKKQGVDHISVWCLARTPLNRN